MRFKSNVDSSHAELNVIFFGNLTKIDQGITHSSQGSINTYFCYFGDFLEA